MSAVTPRSPFEQSLPKRLQELSAAVAEHPVFSLLKSPGAVRLFMEHHVWAVWDFMSLAKSLQAALAPTSVPWTPPCDREAARLINEIVLSEESDVLWDGRFGSHFEAYLEAMHAAGATTAPICRFVELLRDGYHPEAALTIAEAPQAARRFVLSTLAQASATLPERVAAFTLGREQVIPAMFTHAVRGLAAAGHDESFAPFLWYLERHIALDGDEHALLGQRLFNKFCTRTPSDERAALTSACSALEERCLFWDAVAAALQ